MRALRTFAFLVVVLMSFAAVASAQGLSGSITGVVKDTSGAVLPGVTVEASSPALIEKIRSVVTDGTGQYQIVDLRPGTYTVTFTLPGFSTVKREGIELTGSFTATVNAELKVGALARDGDGHRRIADRRRPEHRRSSGSMTRRSSTRFPPAAAHRQLAVLIPGVTGDATRTSADEHAGQTSLAIHGSRDDRHARDRRTA